ncbi:hypothetical protein BDV34DRAFT_188563 [Aspergillus parasiticus]|uniref:Uncharacterized protein n=1 Tax=Aspergillus parasiticus TaxID=5067 RepID=A0A5N6DWZ0_ASPPA|nr:hypothetical protein BDV34DRAFT_188563 [Aspergillus parasiticus]
MVHQWKTQNKESVGFHVFAGGDLTMAAVKLLPCGGRIASKCDPVSLFFSSFSFTLLLFCFILLNFFFKKNKIFPLSFHFPLVVEDYQLQDADGCERACSVVVYVSC